MTMIQVKSQMSYTSNLKKNENSPIGHITVDGGQPSQNGTENDCFYEAVRQATSSTETIEQLRKSTADTLQKDETCKRFYHNWTISSESKQFAGGLPESSMFWASNGLRAGAALTEISAGFTMTAAGGFGGLVGIPLMVHGYDNLQATFSTMYTREHIDAAFTQFLNQEVGLSLDNARLVNDLSPLAGTAIEIKLANRLTRLVPLEYSQIPRKTDFIAGETGVCIPTSRIHLESVLNKPGIKSTSLGSGGKAYDLPDGTRVRIMEPTKYAPLRASFERVNGKNISPINPFTSKPPVNPPRGYSGRTKTFGRKQTHVELDP